jgi:hypothetical protein
MVNNLILYYIWIDKFFKKKFKDNLLIPASYRIFTMNILFYICLVFIVPLILFLFYNFKFSLTIILGIIIIILIIISLIINLFSIKWLNINNQKKFEILNSMDYTAWKNSVYYKKGKRNTIIHILLPFIILGIMILIFKFR